jgi:SAM-dependent methyltransferase
MNGNTRKRVLNAGAGAPDGAAIHPVFATRDWAETRLDIEPSSRPDIVGSIVDMRSQVADGAFDAIYSSHTIEHLYAHEVIPAFHEFRRVIRPDGFALLTCPNLVSAARFMLEHGAEAVAYVSPAGPIRPIDILFGHSESIAQGHHYMAHRTGFDPQRLGRIAIAAGFAEVRMIEGDCFDLWALLLGPLASIEQIRPMFAGSRLEGLCAPRSASHSADVPAFAGAPVGAGY